MWMEPFLALIALDVHFVGILRFSTNTKLLPLLEIWDQFLPIWVVLRAPKESRIVDLLVETVVLVDVVNLAKTDNAVHEYLVKVV